MKNFFSLLVLAGLMLSALAQPPQGFSYQAIIRNAQGEPLASQNVSIRLTLQSDDGNTEYYSETHLLQTSPQGILSVAVGSGSSSKGSLTDIPWAAGGIHFKVEVDPTLGGTYSLLGTTPLLAVPYALFAASGNEGPQGPEGPPGPEGPLVTGTTGQTLRHDGTSWVASSTLHNADANVGIGTVTPSEKLEVAGNIKAQGRLIGQSVEVNQPLPEEEPIFVVRNSAGQIVFAVYEGGVRAYVDDTRKQTRGGFAIGGLSDQIKDQEGRHYFNLSPDSVRIHFRTPAEGDKQTRGGFAIGGLSDQNKEQTATNLLFIAPDSARIYVDSSPSKQTRGGFAIGGLSDQNKNATSNFLFLTPENYFIGHKAGKSNLSGEFNTFFGFNAGTDNLTGSSNSFIGFNSGYSNKFGSNNIFMGNESGYSNVSGFNNSFIGDKSGYSNTNGYYNLFIGNEAGYSNTSGIQNIFIGEKSGYNSSTAFQNLFIGPFSGHDNITGTCNVFIGPYAGYKTTEGYYNVFMGSVTGWGNTTGANNTFIGTEAGRNNSTGNGNTFIGSFAGNSNTSSDQNVFIGISAGYNNVSGFGNLFIGSQAGANTISTWSNVYLGTSSGRNNQMGDGNTYIGSNSGGNGTAGSYNVFIGNWAGYDETGSNKLYISNNPLGPLDVLIYGEFDNSKLNLNAEVNIRDFMVLQPRNSAPASPSKGTVYFDNNDNKLKAWDGESWRDLW